MSWALRPFLLAIVLLWLPHLVARVHCACHLSNAAFLPLTRAFAGDFVAGNSWGRMSYCGLLLSSACFPSLPSQVHDLLSHLTASLLSSAHSLYTVFRLPESQPFRQILKVPRDGCLCSC